MIFKFPSGLIETNAYLIICPETKEAAVIDPAQDSFDKIVPVLEMEGAKLTKVILTHSHWDHIVDCSHFVQAFSPQVLIHKEDAENLRNPGSDGVTCWISIDGVEPTTLLQDQDIITIGKTKWRVLHTPGHTPGGICLYSEEEKLLLSGDTLFRGSIGRLDLATGEPERMWRSCEKLAALPQETTVYPGHGSETKISRESWLKNAREKF